MRDDFDAVVARRFHLLDQVSVPDTWARVALGSESPTAELRPSLPAGPGRTGPPRVVFAVCLAAAAVVAVAMATSLDDGRTDGQPYESLPVSSGDPAVPLFGAAVERFVPGTYYVDEVEGSPTPRIFVTIGDGWSTSGEWGIINDEVGFVSFSRPDAVFLDACNWADGYAEAPLTTLEGLVSALVGQGGWVDVSEPTDISVGGYEGRAFQRTAPGEFVGCDSAFAPFRSWENVDENGDKGWSYYEPGEVETLWIVDVDGTVVIINTRSFPDRAAAGSDVLAAIHDSIRIDPPDDRPAVHR